MLKIGLSCNNDFHLPLLSRGNQLNLTMKRQADSDIILHILRSLSNSVLKYFSKSVVTMLKAIWSRINMLLPFCTSLTSDFSVMTILCKALAIKTFMPDFMVRLDPSMVIQTWKNILMEQWSGKYVCLKKEYLTLRGA